MIERFRQLGVRRKLVIAACVLLAPVVLAAPVMFAFGRVFEGGQRFGIVVTAWTLGYLVAAFAWKAAK
jgi:hypothetical protein